jgi:hypothetical protein
LLADAISRRRDGGELEAPDVFGGIMQDVCFNGF